MRSQRKRSGSYSTLRSLRLESLEDRMVLSATFQDAGINQQAIDAIDDSQYSSIILADETLQNTLDAVASSQSAPANATVLTTVGDLAQITAGTVSSPNVYLIQGDLTITSNINVPSNVHIYVDGSIFKQGTFTAPGGVHSVENGEDAIFFLDNSDNVKLIGIDNALLHSNPNLAASAPHATAVYIGFDSDNVEVDGFEIANVWEGVVARSGGLNIDNTVIKNNYIHDTVGRAIWSLGTNNLEAAHNFIQNAGVDGLDWDAFTNAAIGYENVVIGAGRWAGFVEEAAHDSYFIRGLSLIVDMGNPNRGFMLGWADNGTTIGVVNNSGQQTRHNYFIDNVVFDPGNIPQSGGDYFAKANSGGKGPTYFWANRGFGAGQSTNNFDNAEWLDFVPTAGGRDNSVNGVQVLEDLDEKYNIFAGGDDHLAGDFNDDLIVDAADLAKWQGDYGTGSGSDAEGDGDSDGSDFLAWQRTFGNMQTTTTETVFSYDVDFVAGEGFMNGTIGFGPDNPDSIVGQGSFMVDVSGTGTLNGTGTSFTRALFGLTFGHDAGNPDPFDQSVINGLVEGDSIEIEATGMSWSVVGGSPGSPANVGVFGLSNMDAGNLLGGSGIGAGVQFTSDGTNLFLDTNTNFAPSLEIDTGITNGTPFDYLQRYVAQGGGVFDIEHHINGVLLATSTDITPVNDKGSTDAAGHLQDFGAGGTHSVDALRIEVVATTMSSSSGLATISALGLESVLGVVSSTSLKDNPSQIADATYAAVSEGASSSEALPNSSGASQMPLVAIAADIEDDEAEAVDEALTVFDFDLSQAL